MRFRVPSTRAIIVLVVVFALVVGLFSWGLWYTCNGTVPVLAAICVSRVAIEPIAAVKVDQKSKINEEVLGAHVTGTCHTTGTVQIKLTPNPTKAAFQLTLTGESVSDTIGTHGPAQIGSHAVTKYKAVKPIIFDGDSFETSPAEVTADTDLKINNVSSTAPGIRGRIVTKVATRRVQEAYQQSRQITSQRTIKHVSRQFDAAVQEHLDKLNSDLRLNRLLGQQIAHHDTLPMRLRTTKDGLHVSFLAESGRPGRLPEFAATPNLAVQVGLNLIALAKNPAKTIRTIRHLYADCRIEDPDKGKPTDKGKSTDKSKPTDKGTLGIDIAEFCAVNVGTQGGWIMVEVAEGLEVTNAKPEK